MGFEARTTVPGIAPMRAINVYLDAFDNYRSPGMAPRVLTVPDEADLKSLSEDIAAARAQADLVAVSFHWGDYLRPFLLTDHERREARYCLAHGADLVVGHHHHNLRGMEWIDGKPVLYGLGHFVFDFRLELPEEWRLDDALAADPACYDTVPRPGWPLLPFHPDCRMTVMAWVSAQDGHIGGIGFVPCRLRPDGRVQAVSPDSDEGREVVAYMEKCQTTQQLNGRIECGGPVIGGHASLRVLPAG